MKRLTSGFVTCLVVLVSADPGATQSAAKRDDKPMIAVTGCIDGSWLQVRKTDATGSYTTRYRLRGSKQLLKELSSIYNRHLVEVTGTVTDAANTLHRGKVVDVGKKTRIHVGAKDVPSVPNGQDPSLDVASFRDLNDSCR